MFQALKRLLGPSPPSPKPEAKPKWEPVKLDAAYHQKWAERKKDVVFPVTEGPHYVGEVLNGLAHGQGSYTTPSGTVYEGTWESGQPHTVTGTFTDGAVEEHFRVHRARRGCQKSKAA